MSTDSDHHHHHHTSESYASPPVTLTLTVFLIVFFVVGFLSIYLCRCFMLYVTDALLSRSPSGNAAQPNGSTAPGLDPSIISTFPTFVYSTVKNLRQDKCGLECAVCLSEFEDEDVLRLLPVCNHVFHSECIDLWLKSHTTCPICRRSLDPSQKLPEKSPDMVVTIPQEINRQDNESREDNYSISIKDEEEEEEEEEEMVVVERKQRHESASAEMAVQDGEHEGERFSRFHSTGHSIINIGSEDDRFTLRLPENIKEQILRGHHGTGSCDF